MMQQSAGTAPQAIPDGGADRSRLPADIKARTDIVALIAQDINIKKAGKDYQACCPFHDEKTPSFTVSAEKQFYHCFGCGAHGDVFTWLQEYHRLAFWHALQALGAQAGIPVPRFISGSDAKEAGVSRAISRRKLTDIEDKLAHETYVLMQCLEARRSHRRLSPSMLRRMDNPPPPPEMGERELLAAKRLQKALTYLYPHAEAKPLDIERMVLRIAAADIEAGHELTVEDRARVDVARLRMEATQPQMEAV